MSKWFMRLGFMTLVLILTPGCSGDKGMMFPGPNLETTSKPTVSGSGARTHLWGFYDVYIDIPTKTATAVLNRSGMFSANVVSFLNGNASNLTFQIYGTPVDPGHKFIDIDIDVKIKHPFPGLTQYNGYDVRGIFMGDGSKVMAYNTDLRYADYGAADQVMYDYDLAYSSDDPYPGLAGMPDGYTRWWNPSEFGNPSMPVLGYTQGKLATPGYNATATLNPYKYFADDLMANGNLWTFLASTPNHGVFSAGHQNTRNYYLRFPTPNPNVKFAYAVVADWKGEQPQDHPANGSEAMAVSVTVTPDVYYVSSTEKGGDLKLTVNVFDWDSQPSAGQMEDYKLIIESNVLSAPHVATPAEMHPTGGGIYYSTYYLEIPADNITGNDGNQYWVIVEDQKHDYTNPYGVGNLANTDKLAAFFRHDLYVAETCCDKPPYCSLIVVTPMPATGYSSVPVEFDASASWDPDGDPITFQWDFDGDNAYGGAGDSYTGAPSHPTHVYAASYSGVVNVLVMDNKGGQSICTSQNLAVTIGGCGTLTCPSGTCVTVNSAVASGYNYVDCTRSSNPTRIICNPGSLYKLAAVSMPPDNQLIASSDAAPSIIYSVACDSKDKLYYSGIYGSSIKYTTFDGTSFGPMEQNFGIPIPDGDVKTYRVAVDENDNPIILAINDSNPAITPKIYVWNPGTSSWSSTSVPSTVLPMSPAGASWRNVMDFDYDPTTGYFLLVVSQQCEMNCWNGNPGIFALDKTGNIIWSDIDIFGGLAKGYLSGVEVPQDDPSCHIVVMAGKDGSNGDAYWARFAPDGTGKTTGHTTSSASVGLSQGHWGTLIKNGSTWQWWGYIYGPGFQMKFAYIDMPSDF